MNKEKQLLKKKFKEVELKDLILDMHQGINTVADKVEYKEDGFPIIQSKNITKGYLDLDDVKFLDSDSYNKYFEKYKPNIGDILICNIGTIGKSLLIQKEDKFLIAWNLFLIKINKEIVLPNYLKLYLDKLENEKYYNKLLSGGTVKFINKTKMGSIVIPIPYKDNKLDLETQKRIVEKLELAEKLKENRNKADELTKDYLNAVFLDMFYNKNFEKVELETETSLVSSGSTPKGGSDIYLETGEILFIRSQNVLMHKFSNHDNLYLPLEIHNNMKRTWVKNNDVLLNITGASIGRSTIYLGKDDKANVNQHVCIIRLKEDSNLKPLYLNYYITSNEFQNYIQRINSGGTREALNFTQIKKFQIPIPPIHLQNQFAQIVEQVEKLKEYQQESKEEIDNLFNVLMQQAFRGEL